MVSVGSVEFVSKLRKLGQRARIASRSLGSDRDERGQARTIITDRVSCTGASQICEIFRSFAPCLQKQAEIVAVQLGKILLKIASGFIVAALIVFLPPLFFSMIPGAAIFLVFAPLWVIATSAVVALGFLLTGQLYRTLGTVIFVACVFLFPPVAKLAVRSAGISEEVAGTYRFLGKLEEMVEAKCAAQGDSELKPARGKPDRLILDDFSTWNYRRGYNPLQLTAALAGVEVFEIQRETKSDPAIGLRKAKGGLETGKRETQSYIKSIRSIRADRSGDCTGAGRTTVLSFINTGGGRFSEGLNTNLCFRQITRVDDPLQDGSPAIIVRRGKTLGLQAEVIDVFERSSEGDTLLGRVCYNEYTNKMYPELRAKRARGGAWFIATLGKALGSDLGEPAMKKILVEN